MVNAVGPSALEHVAAEAAGLALRLIKTLGTRKKPVHIGLGAGFTTLRIAHYLAALLRAEPTLPPLVLHALSTGFRIDQPHIAPAAFFSLFASLHLQLAYVGLSCASGGVNAALQHGQITPGVAESFAASGESIWFSPP